MACEACSIKFSLFKRKKQCMDCLRYFCTECVIRRFDRILSCDNCSMLSRRPLIRSQISQMRSKYLRQYLLAKKVNIRGCLEKEDLVNLLLIFANGNDIRRNNERLENVPHNYENGSRREFSRTENSRSDFNQMGPHRVGAERNESRRNESNESESHESNESQSNGTLESELHENSPNRRSRSPQYNERPHVEISTPEDIQEPLTNRISHNVEIEEVLESDDNVNGGPEPVITEHEEVSEPVLAEHSKIFSEVQTWTGSVKLPDITVLSELENLTVKQLKDLLSANRVDYKGCVERCELLDRACRLWEEYRKSRKVIETADEDALCKICLDAPIECVILECGHMACCINCGKQMSECPICRQYVVRVVRFFKA